MKTRMLVIPVTGEMVEYEVDLPPMPELRELERVVMPHLGGAEYLERVRVFYGERYRSMFVDDSGAPNRKNLPVNERASDIYDENLRVHDPEKLKVHKARIHGPAVLFPDREVWS